MEKPVDEVKQDYLDQVHRMQTGVAYKMERDPSETLPKHLRVGINSAMSDHAGLAGLLIKKGIISEDEYVRAVADQMKVEADSYEKDIQKLYGGENIKLG